MAPLNNNKILVTGGTGFFGRALLEEWSRRFDINSLLFSVTVLTRSPKDFLDKFPQFSKYPWLEFHSGDVLDYKSLPSGVSLRIYCMLLQIQHLVWNLITHFVMIKL